MESKPWKKRLLEIVHKYAIRDFKPQYATLIIHWWEKEGKAVVNEFEFIADELSDAARKQELESLRTIIESDANIDNEDQNVKRIVSTINTFIAELDQKVDYEDEELEKIDKELADEEKNQAGPDQQSEESTS